MGTGAITGPKEKQTSLLAVTAAAATGVQVGSAIVATRFVIDQTDPVTLAFLRYFIGFCLLLLPAWHSARGWFDRHDLLPIAALGIGQFGILIVLMNYGLQFIPSARAALIFASVPLLAMTFASLIGYERMTLLKTVGVLLTIAGVAFAMGEKVIQQGAERAGWTGELAVLFIGGSSAIGYYLWLWALGHSSPTKVTVFLSLSPITSAALGALLLAEPISLLFIIGLFCVILGLWLAVWTAAIFMTFGQGTPAPWDPPRKLVIRGPYRHVRNPMIIGVVLMLLAEAMLFRSWPIAGWMMVFWIGNAIYFPLVEEKGLEERFGDAYRKYKAHVPRWIPRMRPWKQASHGKE